MPSLPHRIERTRNRTSRAMLDGDTVVIRLAGRLPAAEEQRHITILLKRMAKAHARLQSAPLIDPFRELLGGKETATIRLVDGTERTFLVTPGIRTRATKKDDQWIIHRSASTTERTFHKFLWRLLSVSEQPRIEASVQTINDTILRARLKKIRLRFMRVRWGSSSRKGSINLNTALLFVPTPLLHYVIVHELMHQKHPDHSSRFWQAVESVLPDYRNHEKILKQYRLPVL